MVLGEEAKIVAQPVVVKLEEGMMPVMLHSPGLEDGAPLLHRFLCDRQDRSSVQTRRDSPPGTQNFISTSSMPMHHRASLCIGFLFDIPATFRIVA